MEKQVISRAFIKRLVEMEMQKCPQCASAQAPEVYWHEEQYGCNWSVDIFARNIVNAEACDFYSQQAVTPLKAKYNMLETWNRGLSSRALGEHFCDRQITAAELLDTGQTLAAAAP